MYKWEIVLTAYNKYKLSSSNRITSSHFWNVNDNEQEQLINENALNEQEIKKLTESEIKVVNDNELNFITDFSVFTSFLNNFIIKTEINKELNIMLNA